MPNVVFYASLTLYVQSSMMIGQLFRLLEDYLPLRDKQQGDPLVYQVHRLAQAIETKKEAQLICSNISEGLDRISDKKLLSKPSYELLERLYEWDTSFLGDKSIFVVLDSDCFESMCVNAVIPQCCVLSPNFFLLRIRDMLQIGSNYRYADDSTSNTLYISGAYKFSQ